MILDFGQRDIFVWMDMLDLRIFRPTVCLILESRTLIGVYPVLMSFEAWHSNLNKVDGVTNGYLSLA